MVVVCEKQILCRKNRNVTDVCMCGGNLQEELEDNMHRLQVDNVRLEAELRHERDRAEMLQAELSDSDKVVGSLLSPLFLSC